MTKLYGVEIPDAPPGYFFTISFGVFIKVQLRRIAGGVEDSILLRDSTALNIQQGVERLLEQFELRHP